VISEAVRSMHALIRRGYAVQGYHHWTLVDNFEWDSGWDLRFGLYELDAGTQRRRPRRSARLFGEIARLNGLEADTLVHHRIEGLLP
jgi:beta-glucosidase